MRVRILQLVDEARSAISDGQFETAHLFFSALHRYASLVRESPVAAKLSEAFQWLVPFLLPGVLDHFRVCTRYEHESPFFASSLEKITGFRAMLRPPVGGFVWAHLVKAVDCELANHLVLDYQFRTRDEVRRGVRCGGMLEKILGVSLATFLQALNFTLDYEEILRKKIPFEERARDLPPKFLVAVVFSGKKKGLIPLEVSDARLLSWAAYLKVDISRVDATVFADESQTEVPLALWK
jgi:hypothetical protein